MPTSYLDDPKVKSLRDYARRDAAAVLIIVLVGLIANCPLLFGSRDLYWGDIELYFAPMQSFLHANLSRGIVPLWNPHIFCGEPFIGNPQTFALYPPAAILQLLPISTFRFITLFDVLHVVLAGIFFYFFAKSESLSYFPSLVSAFVFMLGGCLVSKMQFPNMTAAMAWMPVVLLTVGNVVRAPGLRTACLLAAALGMQLLAGHAQVSLFTLYLAVGYAVYVRKTADKSETSALTVTGWMVCGVVLAGLLAMAQVLPIFDYLRNVDRTSMTLSMANRFTLGFDQLTNCILPNLQGSPMQGNFTGLGNYWETCCYVGVIAAVLALIGALASSQKDSSKARFWTFTLILATWLSLGSQGVIYIDAFYILPGLRSFHDPARFLMIASVAGAMLSGIGLEKLLSASTERHRSWLGVAACACVGLQLIAFDRNVYPTKPDSELISAFSPSAVSSALPPGQRLLFDPDNKYAWRYFVSYQNFHQNDPTYLQDLAAAHVPNVDMLLGIDDAGGYDPEPPKGAVGRYVTGFNDIVDHGTVKIDASSTKLNEMAVEELTWVKLGKRTGKPGFLDSNTIESWWNPGQNIARASIIGTNFNLAVQDLSPDKIAVVIPAHSGSEIVTVADTYMPGWKADIDGGAVPIQRTSDGLCNIDAPVNTQTSTLFLRYEPASYRIGLYLSLLTGAFLLTIAINTVLSRR